MLDQSFSAHNLEVIFDLENRKGNIDINWMPEEYRAAATWEQGGGYLFHRKNKSVMINS